MTSKRIDVNKLESLRTALLLSRSQMAQIIGVSRISYYNWRKGNEISHTSEYAAKAAIRKLAGIYMSGMWPTPESHSMTGKKRFAALLALMEEDAKSATEEVKQPQDGAPA